MITLSLLCKICGARQPVTTPDAEDEDPRTQAIRREFRAEHLKVCGAGSVKLDVQGDDSGQLVDEEPLINWPEYVHAPDDVRYEADGFFTRKITRDGVQMDVRVCESCWRNIPRYVDFPFGLTAPDSDGDASGNGAKVKRVTVEGKRGIEHMRKAVCLPCYYDAFSRMYPGAILPELNDAVIGDGAPISPPPPPPDEPSAEDPLKFEQALLDRALEESVQQPELQEAHA